MIATAPDRSAFRLPPPGPRPSRHGWLTLAALVALLGVLVVNHGCHGEHVDDELSAVQTSRAGGDSK